MTYIDYPRVLEVYQPHNTIYWDIATSKRSLSKCMPTQVIFYKACYKTHSFLIIFNSIRQKLKCYIMEMEHRQILFSKIQY